jgi:CRP/FNR family cyclic AMP-dependent transcriptional regulator
MDILRLFESAENLELYPAGSVIFNAGDSADQMYVLVDGEIELRKGDVLLNTIGRGALFGEMALLSKQTRSATAVARTNSRVAPISEKRFLFLVQQTPFFALHVMRVMGERLLQKEAALEPESGK